MTEIIIYKQDDGVLSILTPSNEALTLYGIDGVAQRDVPDGKLYRIMDAGDLPEDQSQRNTWTVDDAELSDGVGGSVK